MSSSAANPVAIAVAPVDYSDPAYFPSADQLVDDIVQCHAAGASVVHFHVTDAQGRPTRDPTFFEGIVRRVRSACDILIEGSTGGVGSTVEERSVVLNVPGVELASLNMGSCNLFGRPYVNSPDDIRAWAERMRARGILPDMCFFEPGFFTALPELQARGWIGKSCLAGLCLGFPNALPATVENLVFMQSKLPPGAVWTLVHHGGRDFSLLAAAMACGGHIRVGFEDSPYLTPQQKATSNHQLVEHARQVVRHLGREVATPAAVRQALEMSNEE